MPHLSFALWDLTSALQEEDEEEEVDIIPIDSEGNEIMPADNDSPLSDTPAASSPPLSTAASAAAPTPAPAPAPASAPAADPLDELFGPGPAAPPAAPAAVSMDDLFGPTPSAATPAPAAAVAPSSAPLSSPMEVHPV